MSRAWFVALFTFIPSRLLIFIQLHAEKSLRNVNYEALRSFQVNTVGHLMVYKHFLELIPLKQAVNSESKGRGEDPSYGLLPEDESVFVSVTARVGSISDNHSGG